MPTILHIDTATEMGSVFLSGDTIPSQLETNIHQREHASWLHTAIQKILIGAGVSLKDIDAVAVSIGPGSYTGLRVGLSAAKGICYSMGIPLIPVNTLLLLASAAIQQEETSFLICPAIDARRMEVFTAVYDNQLQEILAPQAMILNETSFDSFLTKSKMILIGSGSAKINSIIKNKNVLISKKKWNASSLQTFALQNFSQKNFANLAYIEPLYLKEFYTPQ